MEDDFVELPGSDPSSQDRAYWYRQGKDDGIEQERGNIVEWLRSDRIVLSMDGVTEDVVASAIEAGEHLK